MVLISTQSIHFSSMYGHTEQLYFKIDSNKLRVWYRLFLIAQRGSFVTVKKIFEHKKCLYLCRRVYVKFGTEIALSCLRTEFEKFKSIKN